MEELSLRGLFLVINSASTEEADAIVEKVAKWTKG